MPEEGTATLTDWAITKNTPSLQQDAPASVDTANGEHDVGLALNHGQS